MVPTMPASNHSHTSASEGVSQMLAEDNTLHIAQMLHDNSSACLPDLPDIVMGDYVANGQSHLSHPVQGLSPPHIGISSSSCQSQLRYSSSSTHVHSTGSSTQTASLEEDTDYNMLSSYHDCTDAHEPSTVALPTCLSHYFASSGDSSMDGYVLEVLQDTHSSSWVHLWAMQDLLVSRFS